MEATTAHSLTIGDDLPSRGEPFTEPLSGTTLLLIAVGATVFGLVFILLLAFLATFCIRKCCRTKRRKMVLPIIDLDEKEAEELHREIAKTHTNEIQQINTSQTEETAALITELPSPPKTGDEGVIGHDTIQRNSWVQRHSSFRLAYDASLPLVKKRNTMEERGYNFTDEGKIYNISVDQKNGNTVEDSPVRVINETQATDDKRASHNGTASQMRGLNINQSEPESGPVQRRMAVEQQRIATVRPTNSLRQISAYKSFIEHLEQYGQPALRSNNAHIVRTPTIRDKSVQSKEGIQNHPIGQPIIRKNSADVVRTASLRGVRVQNANISDARNNNGY